MFGATQDILDGMDTFVGRTAGGKVGHVVDVDGLVERFLDEDDVLQGPDGFGVFEKGGH